MHSELTAKELALIEYEKKVLKAAKEIALLHIGDVLASAEAMLRRAREDAIPQHDGKVASPSGLLQGRSIAISALAQLPLKIDVRTIDYVTIADKQDRLSSHDSERVASSVDGYVGDVLFKLSLYRRFSRDTRED